MTNKELQQNALAISEIIAQSGVSSEEAISQMEVVNINDPEKRGYEL